MLIYSAAFVLVPALMKRSIPAARYILVNRKQLFMCVVPFSCFFFFFKFLFLLAIPKKKKSSITEADVERGEMQSRQRY